VLFALNENFSGSFEQLPGMIENMDETVILRMEAIRKAFGGAPALEGVHFELHANEIHGLLGGNGAGKTTLMNILFGLYRMDSGDVYLHGQKISISAPKDAIAHRINMVHQHFLQVESFSVLENILIGAPLKDNLTLSFEPEVKKITDIQKRFGLDIDLDTMLGDLPMGTRQKVEILKALYRGVEILILDEPTTNLTPQEVDSLFQSLRVMVEDGLSIVFITHKLREVLSVCDRISVLRNGKNVTTLRRGEASEEAFVRGMVGDEMNLEKSIIFSDVREMQQPAVMTAEPVLNMDAASLRTPEGLSRLKDVQLAVHQGEIFGIAGVAGNGQSELAEAILGLQPVSAGRITLSGADIHQKTTAQLLETEIAYIPEDRLHDGFLPKANIAQNLVLGAHRARPYSNGWLIDWKIVFSRAREMISQYNIKTSGPAEVGGNLSGGNIQRVMIARAFSRQAHLMIAHNPTRGLDIPSMDFVYSRFLERKNAGAATLLISEDLDELLLLCDRIGVIYKGEILGILPREKFEKYAIGQMMSGVRPGA
jgi:simple sugar transport system ATP-binding protein